MTDEKGAPEYLESLRLAVEGDSRETHLSFNDFSTLVEKEPQRVLRNIFQLFYDMVQDNIVRKEDEYPDDPESIGYVEYDCSKIFVEKMAIPFFADRPFANRFVRQVKDFKHGSQQNKMHVYVGPPGCGKSTFLDNLLQKFEEYSRTEKGQTFEIFWELDESLLTKAKESQAEKAEKIEIPCPSHDHPILIFPKEYRSDILGKLLSKVEPEIKQQIFSEKEYDWLFEGRACTICESLFDASCQKLGSLDQVLSMVKVRPYRFNRRTGEGISVFNPGDRPLKEMFLSDENIQKNLDRIFGTNKIKYVFSHLARTNNGIYVLMDVKSQPPHNKERFWELHNIVSEGVHKVNGVEERINSLLMALMNPEDKEGIEKEKQESFQARISENEFSYVMEVATEVKVYRSTFGKKIDSYFLPRILDNFARVIISTRMNRDCGPLKDWIKDLKLYNQKHLCDANGLLLRMEIYGGIIPTWLSEEDKRKFTSELRRNLIDEARKEGKAGFCGRDSLKYFGELKSIYGPKRPEEAMPRLIGMDDVVDYFKKRISSDARGEIPPGFIDSLVDWYDFAILNEVKESLYFYNRDQIKEDILHYLWAINWTADGQKTRCKYTGKEIEVTIEFLRLIGSYVTGESVSEYRAKEIALEVQKKYLEVIARDRDQEITGTELYKELFNSYTRNLKDKVLEPFLENDNFREAIKVFGTEAFDNYDAKLTKNIKFMIQNLIKKLGYTEQGAKEICLRVLDRNLNKRFS